MKGIFAMIVLLQGYQTSQSAGIISKEADNSSITYVQIKPLINRSLQTNLQDSSRASRIENIPLQIRGAQTHPYSTAKPQELKSLPVDTVRTPRSDEKVAPAPSPAVSHAVETTEKLMEISDQNHESEDRFDTSEAVLPELEIINLNIETLSPKISDSQENDLFNKAGGFFAKNAVVSSHFSKPKFFSLKKYYGGNLDTVEPGYRKYLETRRFRSRCRCERIWNCPKLQVSVPRCPAEYFLCCF